MIAASILVSLLVLQSPPACSDAPGCRAAALDAYARKDFEAFHDLAWLAYRKGSPDDAELMLMLARAQSLSGRPNDAFDILQRLAGRGIKTDAATSDDFARVRAMDKWKQAYGETAPSTAMPGAPPAPSFAPSNPATPKSAPSTSAVPKTTPSPAAPPPAAPAPSVAPPARSSRSVPGVLSFTTLMKPTAMAYDAVSRRYLIADRSARRVSVLDEHSGQLSTFVGSQGSLGEIGGLAIDPQQGDLWVVSASGSDTSLHRLQLISGRVLSKVAVAGANAPIVGLAWIRGTGLVAADASGQISRVSAGGRLQPIVRLEYDPAAIAADAAGRLYVSPGGSRLARFALDVRTGAREVLSLPEDRIVEGGIAISGDRLHLLTVRDGAYEIRTMPLKR